MSFVRGHWRALGWVRSHRRKPNRPQDGQLPLPATPQVVIPTQRASVDGVVRPVRR